MIKLHRPTPFIGPMVLLLTILACSVPGSISDPPEESGAVADATEAPTTVPTDTLDTPSTTQPDATVQPTDTPAVATTVTDTDQQTDSGVISVSFDGIQFEFAYAIADSWAVEVVPAGPAMKSSAGPSDFTDPPYTEFRFGGYPHPDTQTPWGAARVLVYPAVDLAQQNEPAGNRLEGLRNYIDNTPTGGDELSFLNPLPYLPMFNGSQMYHTQLDTLIFENGRGIRYLTQFSQSIVPAVNLQIHYTFQGLTDDGQYVVMFIMPISHPYLEGQDEVADYDTFAANYQSYLIDITQHLNAEPDDSFTPDLSLLDAMARSLTIKP